MTENPKFRERTNGCFNATLETKRVITTFTESYLILTLLHRCILSRRSESMVEIGQTMLSPISFKFDFTVFHVHQNYAIFMLKMLFYGIFFIVNFRHRAEICFFKFIFTVIFSIFDLQTWTFLNLKSKWVLCLILFCG